MPVLCSIHPQFQARIGRSIRPPNEARTGTENRNLMPTDVSRKFSTVIPMGRLEFAILCSCSKQQNHSLRINWRRDLEDWRGWAEQWAGGEYTSLAHGSSRSKGTIGKWTWSGQSLDIPTRPLSKTKYQEMQPRQAHNFLCTPPFDQEADSVSGDHLINSRRFCQVSFFLFTDTPHFPLGRGVYASRGLLWGVLW